MVKKLILAVFVAALALFTTSAGASAAVLENSWFFAATPIENTTTDHTYRFAIVADSGDLTTMTFQYCEVPSGSCGAPAGMEWTSPTATTVTQSTDGGEDRIDWNDPTWNNVTKMITFNRTAAETSPIGDWVMTFGSINNADFGDCTESANSSSSTCYIRINGYAETVGSLGTAIYESIVTQALTLSVTVSARVDPSFSFEIYAIDPSSTATANGTTLTSGVTPSVTTLPFSNLTPGTQKFLGHRLMVTTNTPEGYSVTVRMNANMTGTAYGSDIDPFVGSGATTTSSQSWILPTGTAAGVDTGWLGVGTDDSDVTSGSNEFFSLSSAAATTIANHDTSAQSEMDLVVYGIEVNSYQQADSYSGTMRYQALPVY